MTALFFDDIIAFKEMMYEQRSAETEKEMKRRKREGRYCRACHNQTLRAAAGPGDPPWKDIRGAFLAEVKSSAYGDLDRRPTRRLS